MSTEDDSFNLKMAVWVGSVIVICIFLVTSCAVDIWGGR